MNFKYSLEIHAVVENSIAFFLRILTSCLGIHVDRCIIVSSRIFLPPLTARDSAVLADAKYLKTGNDNRITKHILKGIVSIWEIVTDRHNGFAISTDSRGRK
jgi:hypothetical protein